MGNTKARYLSVFYRALNLYLAVGLLLAFPVFMSYLISTPILIFRMVSGHASPLHTISVAVFFPAYGLLTAIWKMLSWPFSLFALAHGMYPSFWSWLAPGFWLVNTVPIR
ncbi:MAG TPA: hypothetical protein VFW47_09930 [Phenylobacterium sp.]|nr:hypothetical protein [Phenylobacterium sp.]